MKKLVRTIVKELNQRDLLDDVRHMATTHHVTVHELLGSSHGSTMVAARHAVWRHLYEHPMADWSINRIAGFFGVDRSTVRNALRGRGRKRAA
jgi:hypothetical protein